MYRRDEKCIQNFSRQSEGKRPHRTLEVDGRIILRLTLRNGVRVCIGFIWLRTGFSGGIFRTRRIF